MAYFEKPVDFDSLRSDLRVVNGSEKAEIGGASPLEE